MFYGCYNNEKPNEFVYSSYLRNNFSIISNLAECDRSLSFLNNKRSSVININHNLQLSCWEIADIYHYSWTTRCVGSKQHHEWQLEYLEQSLDYYQKKNKRTFSFTSFDEAHDPSFDESCF